MIVEEFHHDLAAGAVENLSEEGDRFFGHWSVSGKRCGKRQCIVLMKEKISRELMKNKKKAHVTSKGDVGFVFWVA